MHAPRPCTHAATVNFLTVFLFLPTVVGAESESIQFFPAIEKEVQKVFEPVDKNGQVDLVHCVNPISAECCEAGYGEIARKACCCSRWDQLSFFSGLDGSKQPQDYGVNADLGIRLRTNYSAPLHAAHGIGFQIGTAITWSDNAVRVFEVLGEDTSRHQSFTTAGIFQRAGRWGWGGVFDFLHQDSFDTSSLGQFRARVTYDVSGNTLIGATGRFRAFDDTAQFLGNRVTLRSMNQGSLFCRHFFETGVQATGWIGMVDEHGESNVVTGPAPSKNNTFVFGADILAPLNDSLAIYGETNIVTPADTGTVDAFLGVAWYPFGNAKCAHRARFSPMFPVAASTSLSVDLLP